MKVQSCAEKDYLADVVQRLVLDDVQDEDVLILLACTASSDPKSNAAMKLFRGFTDGALGRCVGVPTKPDLVSVKEHKKSHQLLDMLTGRDYMLGTVPPLSLMALARFKKAMLIT